MATDSYNNKKATLKLQLSVRVCVCFCVLACVCVKSWADFCQSLLYFTLIPSRIVFATLSESANYSIVKLANIRCIRLAKKCVYEFQVHAMNTSIIVDWSASKEMRYMFLLKLMGKFLEIKWKNFKFTKFTFCQINKILFLALNKRKLPCLKGF